MSAFIPTFTGIYIEYFDNIPRPPQWLPQVSLSSLTKLHHTASRTLLTQTFINPSTVAPIPSAKYTFPLYESCAIVAFRCYVGQRLIEGVIKEKEDASATYQAAVGRNEPASLLEQHTTDVFSTSIGNIPAGETIKVEIEYIMELKHDAEVDGLRFTIPTSIAPRYGTPPSELTAGYPTRAVSAKNMDISIEVTMSSSIKSIQSPSHPISLHLGAHVADAPDDSFNPQHALATLGQTTTELGKDFILLIKCANLSSPAALLEEHPTIPNSKALMVTLVPKFNLPESTKPEVVFIVDRSGSMSSRVAPLKSSLSVFLKSLPLDINFNICSFGSQHSFLWPKSRPYSNQSFAEAQKYCDGMKADFGGTEILPAIKSTIEKRLKDLNLEIMVLTDGEVWNSEILFEHVEKATEKGDVRLFSLGIGRDVSHSLIDGLARVGRGFSQVVSDEREGMESKVARMLRGGLSAHVVNYRLEWEDKQSTEAIKKKKSPIVKAIRRFSLFDSNANTDAPVSFSDNASFTIPSVIQAPYKIQPLFPFSRSTAYAILSPDARPPSTVWLRGTTPEGDELELEIAVQKLPAKGETIHQLAARKVLQELKDGTSYVHGAVDKEKQPALLAEWVKKEGVRVGLKYGVASHWTSFVAVERKDEKEEEKEKEMEMEEKKEMVEEEDKDQEVAKELPPSVLGDDEEEDEDWATVVERARDSDGEFGPDDMIINRSLIVDPTVMATPSQPIPPIFKSNAPLSSTAAASSTARFRTTGYKFGSSKGTLPSNSAFTPGRSARPGVVMDVDDTASYSSLSGPVGSLSPQPTGSLNAPSVIGSIPIGKGNERERERSHTARQSALRRSIPKPLSAAPNPFHTLVSQQSLVQSGGGSSSARSSSSSSGKGGYSLFGSFGSKKKSAPPAPPPNIVESQSQYVGTLSSPLPPPGPFAGADRDSMYDSFSAMLPNKTGMAPYMLQSQDEYMSPPSIQKGYSGPSKSSKNFSSDSKKIGISYSPSSAPPPERLSADTGAKPLSLKTKSLINLQTFEGSFVLDSALATLLGVSITVLEAKLTGLTGLSVERRKKVWATVLAVKLFESELAGERSVWQLVVDKAKSWMWGVDGVGVEDIIQLEKLAGEVLGV